ncbi:MAG: VOC family protein [Chloroflexi bacterium]|nr:VOC family protein [Chloroflexota bacterium]
MATHPQTGAAHHIRLTVTDPARSRDFYTELLGFQVAMEFPDGVLVSNGTLLLGLRTGPDTARVSVSDRFDPNRVGLDHLALSVGSRGDIEAAARLLDERGVTHGEIVDLGPDFGLYVMMLEDPDGIQLELTAPHS